MSKKLYFSDHNPEMCCDIESHRDYMRENFIESMVLFEAKRETGTGYFFCKEFGECGLVGEGCGKFCEKYQPNNGKNGRCKHYGYCYEQTDKKFILTNSELTLTP